MKRMRLLLLIVFCSLLLVENVYAESLKENQYHAEGVFYVDGILHETADKVLFILPDYINVEIPLRAVLEAIGAEVTWEEEKNITYIKYQEDTYVMKQALFMDWLSSGVPYNIYATTIQRLDSYESNEGNGYIRLGSEYTDEKTGDKQRYAGVYCSRVNGRTYMYVWEIERLLNYFGYSIDMDIEKRGLYNQG